MDYSDMRESFERPPHSPQRDAAWGRFYGRRGARVITSSIEVPTPAERMAQWAVKACHLPRGYGSRARLTTHHQER